MIRFLPGNEIDRSKWDNCISRSFASHIYGCSWYLDLIAPGWAGLVKGDYESVMPLPLRRKFLIRYAFQPLLGQQLGVYSGHRAECVIADDFLKAVPHNIRYLNFNLNHTNVVEEVNFDIESKTNYELFLRPPYEKIHQAYSANARRNVLKAASRVNLKTRLSLDDFINFIRNHPTALSNYQSLTWLMTFCEGVMKKCQVLICGAEVNGKLCAAAFFVRHAGRIYYFLPVSVDEGKRTSAMFCIIDSVVRKHSGSDLILDFEGSVIPGIARFFEGFGARPVGYNEVVINRLPFLLRGFK